METNDRQDDPNQAIGTSAAVSPLDPRITSLVVSQKTPATKSSWANLRSKFSRRRGSVRRPKRPRAKSLTHPRPTEQIFGPPSRQLEARASLQSPPITGVRHSVSAPAIHRKPVPEEPRYIGLQDRLAKVPVATPITVRKANVQNPTDQTMATRGSGSTTSGPDGDPSVTTGSRPQEHGEKPGARARHKAPKDEEDNYSVWRRVKFILRKVFSHKKE
ncbi:MAG: hypothetical protein Q9220_004327 [cf. Caloplaca sp. 1 TL-2023]